jgi:hypothetical protein
MRVAVAQAAALVCFAYLAFLRGSDFFWFHPFAMTLAFVSQNLSAHVMKLETKPLYVHVACSSSATLFLGLGV